MGREETDQGGEGAKTRGVEREMSRGPCGKRRSVRLESGERGRLSAQITGSCVFCHIKFDARPPPDWSRPLPIMVAVAQAVDVVPVNAGLPLSRPPPSLGVL